MTIAPRNITGNGLLAPSQSNLQQVGSQGSEVQGFRAGPSASAKASVMLEFQRTSLEMTCRFLETQQRVMLAYLSGAAESGDGALPPQTLLLPQFITPPPGNLVREWPVKQPEEKAQPLYAEQVSILVSSNSAPAQTEAITVTVDQEPDRGTVSSEYLISSLIEIISDRTGYPPEMLDPALDLEADLGIDSIKRVEVLNSFRKLLSKDQQAALEDGIEELAGMKTLQSLTDWIRNDLVPRISVLQTVSPPEFASRSSIGATGDLNVQ